MWLDAELLVENDVNPAAAAAAALAADAGVGVVDDAWCIGAGNTTPPTADVRLVDAATPPARTCTVTGSGPDVRTGLL